MKITNYLGEFSGKLGGMVFSRNKGGAYVRKFVTPINPSTSKQRTVRERFSQRALEFRALPAETKAMWAEYVQTYYSPLTGSGKGNALNAFVSCRQAVDNANSVAQQTTFDVSTNPTTPFQLPTIPPDKPLAANVRLQERIFVPTIKNVSYAPGTLSVRIDISDGTPIPPSEFENENGVRVSLNLYCSSPSGGNYFSNPYRALFAATAGVRFDDIQQGRITISGGITLQSSFNYRCTLVLMDEYGQQLPVSTLDFTVPANP